jgi:hypothetical protein
VVSAVVLTATSVVLLWRPAQWRLDNEATVTTAYGILALIAAVAVGAAGAERRSRWAQTAVGAVAFTAAVALGTLPHVPYAFSGYDHAIYNERPVAAGYAALRDRIGPDTHVVYLTFGAINYLIGNPTTCRYPSPQWLQRATWTNSPVPEMASYADNLRCLTDDTQARYLVWQPQWFNVSKSSPQVRTLISQRFDCSPQLRIPAPKELMVCPARD